MRTELISSTYKLQYYCLSLVFGEYDIIKPYISKL